MDRAAALSKVMTTTFVDQFSELDTRQNEADHQAAKRYFANIWAGMIYQQQPIGERRMKLTAQGRVATEKESEEERIVKNYPSFDPVFMKV